MLIWVAGSQGLATGQFGTESSVLAYGMAIRMMFNAKLISTAEQGGSYAVWIQVTWAKNRLNSVIQYSVWCVIVRLNKPVANQTKNDILYDYRHRKSVT